MKPWDRPVSTNREGTHVHPCHTCGYKVRHSDAVCKDPTDIFVCEFCIVEGKDEEDPHIVKDNDPYK